MFKKLMSAVAAAALCVSLAACGATATSEAAAEASATPAPAVTETPAEETASAETADGALRVAGLKGPTTMGLVNLLAMEKNGTASQNYDLQLYGAADEVVPKLIKGEVDIAAIPANLAATLYQKTSGGIQVMAVNTLGVLYVVEKGFHLTRARMLAQRCGFDEVSTLAAPESHLPSRLKMYLREPLALVKSFMVDR